MATIFNKYFKNKVTSLGQKTATEATIEPAARLRAWLGKRPEPPPEFKIKKIGISTLRKALKRMKGKRVHGKDEIDSFSLKLAAHLIKDSLEHFVTIQITTDH